MRVGNHTRRYRQHGGSTYEFSVIYIDDRAIDDTWLGNAKFE